MYVVPRAAPCNTQMAVPRHAEAGGGGELQDYLSSWSEKHKPRKSHIHCIEHV